LITKGKKGFTLIEIIISFAVFAILLTVILAAFLTSAVICSKGSRKLKSMNYADGIVQCIKSKSTSEIAAIYNKNIKWYIYFNENSYNENNGYYDVLDYMKKNVITKFSTAPDDALASKIYEYKCCIAINKDNAFSTVDIYFIKVEVCNIKSDGDSSKATREIFIGR
jgi:prepilin-type N-terminal cleavage/methylation domain-containing protein